MTSLLTRLGQRESRTATQTLWNSGKRKRQDWICQKCRAHAVVQQRRKYSDGNNRASPDQYLFPPREQREDGGDKRIYTRIHRGRPQAAHKDQWAPGGGDGRFLQSLEDDMGDEGEETSWAVRDSDGTAPSDVARSELWEHFESLDDDEGTTTDTNEARQHFVVDTSARTFRLHAERDASLLELDYATVLPEALRKREPDLTARCLLAASQANDLDFIRSLDEASFSDVLRVMEPANSIDKLASAHLELSDAMVAQLGIASMQQVAWDLSDVVSEITAIRRSDGIRLTLDDYAVLLRGARDLGNRHMANQLWKHLHRDNHVPNIDCYNYYMAIAVFDRLHQPANARHKLRIIPFHMLARRHNPRGDPFRGFSVGPGGVKDKVVGAFGQMLKNGAIANEESFRIVIMAAAREGELSTVRSVLRKVWNVDVDALLAGQEESEILPKQVPKDSTLYPTSKLLFTIAHAYGINNDIPTALRLVDFVARHYKLTISEEVWSQLFEWTFVLACPHTGKNSAVDGTKTGKLPLQSVMDLWVTMTGAPYFVRPNMGMYNRLIKNLSHRQMSPAIVEKMQEGRQIYFDSIDHARKLYTGLNSGLILSERDPTLVESLEHLRSEWEISDLHRKRNLFWVKRWLRLLLSGMRKRIQVDFDGDWSYRHIPRLLWEWKKFAPTRVSYEIVGGNVEFDIRSQEEIDASALSRAGRLSAQQRVLDRVSRYVGHMWMREGVKLLPSRMVSPEGKGSSVPVSKYLQREMGAHDRGQRASEEDGAPEDLRQQVREAVDDALDRR